MLVYPDVGVEMINFTCGMSNIVKIHWVSVVIVF
jgi:hypothetical protein